MKAISPSTEFILWRNKNLFNIDFASYTLSHHSFSRHFHDHYVIELVVKGADKFYCNGKTYTASNNQLVLINPGEVHTGSTISDTPLHYFSFYPDKKTISEIADTLNISLVPDFNFQRTLINHGLLAEKFLLLFAAFQRSAPALEQEELFFDCMNTLLLPFHANEMDIVHDKKDNRITQVTDFININFKEEVSLQQLSELVRLNPFHLSRTFKKITGLSPYEYLLIKRSEHAKQLLRKGYKVQDAALEAGFYDASHFNRLFRKIAIPSPKAFRSSKSQYRTISASA